MSTSKLMRAIEAYGYARCLGNEYDNRMNEASRLQAVKDLLRACLRTAYDAGYKDALEGNTRDPSVTGDDAQ